MALKKVRLKFSETAVRDMIRYYSREAGVRSLERDIRKFAEKVVKDLLLKQEKTKVSVTPENLDKYLGVRRFNYGLAGRTGSGWAGDRFGLDTSRLENC